MTVRALRSLQSALAYEGWGMVAIGFTCIALAFGASTATMPLIYDEVMTEFGWTRTQATMFYTYKSVAAAGMALFVIAPLYMRFGLRPVMIGSQVVAGLGMVAFLWINSLPVYYLAGFVLGLGASSVLVSTKILISRWFMRRQGMAIGIVLTGANAGGLFFPVLCQWLIETTGWRMAFALLSLGIWAVSLPLYALKSRNEPSQEETRAEVPNASAAPQPEEPAVPISSVMRSGTFWTVIVCVFLVSVADMGVFQHTALFLEREVGVSATTAAYCISGIFGMGILAKILAGRIFDRWSVKGISVMYLLSAVAILSALSIQGSLTLLLFVLLRGFSHGGLVSETPVLAKHCYGPRLMDFTLPVFAGAWAVGAALGPVALSVVHEQSGSYQLGFLICVLVTVLAAALLYRVRPLYRLSLMARETAESQPETAMPARVEGGAPSSR